MSSDRSTAADECSGLPVRMDRTEFLVCSGGQLELRNQDHPERWIATDSPAEVRR